MRIIFLGTVHFTKKLYNDLYVDKISKYYEVEKWSVLKINDNVQEKRKNIKFHDEVDDVIYIETLDELSKRLYELGEKPIIITAFFDPLTLNNIYNIIKQHGGVVIDIYKNAFTDYIRRRPNKLSKSTSLLKWVKMLMSSNRFIWRLYWRIKSKSKQLDYCLTPPKLTYTYAKKIVPIHHIKYDTYLDATKEAPVLNSKYAVFLDSNLPYLNDITVLLGENSVNPEKYFMLLNRFFDYIENRFSIEVVVAPHPQANYANDIFNGRRIIKYKTANLIHNSQFVITHDTTSNINAVLSNKPIIFVFYEEMLNKGTKQWAEATIKYSQILKAPLIDLEKQLHFEPIVDEKSYRRFINKFIINQKEKDKTTEEIMIKFLRSLN